MIVSALLVLAMNLQIAQQPTPAPTTTPSPAPAVSPPVIDTRGPCLDSAKAVPDVLSQPVERSSEIARIDKVVSTATYTPNEIIGFLYTREDGKTFLGMRALQYTSPATAQAINQVLASTHAPGVIETQFPPQTRLGVRTGFAQFFEVKIPTAALRALEVRMEPCVAWPAGRELPDPGPGP
ncbi:MAG: hypothetical protein NVS1B14_02370 [Vulcanimicrobiaceae bacterium]